MSSEFPPPEDNEARQIYEALHQSYGLVQTPFTNIALSTQEAGFANAHDPHVVYEQQFVTMFWPPGRADDLSLHTLGLEGTDNLGPIELTTQYMRLRRAILKASVGKAALNRVPQSLKNAQSEFHRELPIDPLTRVKVQCTVQGIPLAVCQMSRVVQSDVLPENSNILHMWHPEVLPAKEALRFAKERVRAVQKSETL